MGVVVREKDKGSGDWWVFINQNKKRRAIKVGDKKHANELRIAILVESTLKAVYGHKEELNDWDIQRLWTESLAKSKNKGGNKMAAEVKEAEKTYIQMMKDVLSEVGNQFSPDGEFLTNQLKEKYFPDWPTQRVQQILSKLKNDGFIKVLRTLTRATRQGRRMENVWILNQVKKTGPGDVMAPIVNNATEKGLDWFGLVMALEKLGTTVADLNKALMEKDKELKEYKTIFDKDLLQKKMLRTKIAEMEDELAKTRDELENQRELKRMADERAAQFQEMHISPRLRLTNPEAQKAYKAACSGLKNNRLFKEAAPCDPD